METFTLLREKPLPQDLPVDLTTKNNLHQQTLKNHLTPKMSYEAYPHLRFHKSLIGEPDSLKENKEKQRLDEVPYNIVTNQLLCRESKDSSLLSQKRRLDDVQDEYYVSSKKLRVEQFQPSTAATQSYFPKSVERTKDLFPICHPSHYFDQSHVLEHSALIDRMQSHHCISGSQESIKETEALMAAVQHSQMLYYSYCTQLLQNLQAQKVIHKHELITKSPRSHSEKITSGRDSRKALDNQSKPESKLEVLKNDRVSPTSSGTALRTCSTPASSPSSSVGSPQTPMRPSSGNEREDKVTSTAEKKLPSGRKRVPRALTGKHVRPGTGASITTLLSLRQKLNERQKLRKNESNSEKQVESFVRQERSPCWRRR